MTTNNNQETNNTQKPASEIITNQNITFFARTNFRNRPIVFGIKRSDRRNHLYILGKTGTGKSTLLESLMTDDLKKGFGFEYY